MPTKLIVFDCDGVLRSASWEGIFKAYQAICEFLEKDSELFFTNVDEFKSWYDPDWIKNLTRIGVKHEDNISKITLLFHKVYDPFIHTFPWVKPMIKELSSRYTITILSSSMSHSVAKSLDGFGNYISMVVGSEHVKKIKPHPEGVNLILRKFNISPKEIWIIGDTYADIFAGKRAGTKTAVVAWGLSDPKEIISFGADKIIIDPEEILLL